MNWTDTFVPPPPAATPVAATKSKVGMIAGAAAAAVVILALVGFIFYRRGQRQQKNKRKDGKGGKDEGVTVVPISAIDENHIWQPPTLVPQSIQSTPVIDPYAQQLHHQPVHDHQQQLQYLTYDQQQQQPVNTWPSPTVQPDGSPTATGYSTTAYSPYQQHQYTDGTQAYKSDEGYVLPPVSGGSYGDEYKVEHTPEPNRASINGRAPQAPQLHGDSAQDLENETSAGVNVPNVYVH